MHSGPSLKIKEFRMFRVVVYMRVFQGRLRLNSTFVMSFGMKQVNKGCWLLRGAIQGRESVLSGSEKGDNFWKNCQCIHLYTLQLNNCRIRDFIAASEANNFPKIISLRTPALSAPGTHPLTLESSLCKPTSLVHLLHAKQHIDGAI